jgi:hypothetical protein
MRDQNVEILKAYSEGRISRNKAMSTLDVEFPELLNQLSKSGLALPRVPTVLRDEMAEFVATLETGLRI